jgi:hypothetical protein
MIQKSDYQMIYIMAIVLKRGIAAIRNKRHEKSEINAASDDHVQSIYLCL